MCDTNNYVPDDFYENAQECPQVSITIRTFMIIVLCTISVINIVICMIKLVHTACVWQQLTSKRLLFSVLLTFVHYLCVVITCVFLFGHQMNEYWGTIVTGSIALTIGCLEICFHLMEILYIYSQSTLLRNHPYMIQLQRVLLTFSVAAGINWFTWSGLSYVNGKQYTYLCCMWIGLSVATFIWSICFYVYGTRALNEIQTHSTHNQSNTIPQRIFNKLKWIIYSYSTMCFTISIVSILVITIRDLFKRTFYAYAVMGSVLGMVDMLYVIIISLTHSESVHQQQFNQVTRLNADGDTEIQHTGRINRGQTRMVQVNVKANVSVSISADSSIHNKNNATVVVDRPVVRIASVKQSSSSRQLTSGYTPCAEQPIVKQFAQTLGGINATPSNSGQETPQQYPTGFFSRETSQIKRVGQTTVEPKRLPSVVGSLPSVVSLEQQPKRLPSIAGSPPSQAHPPLSTTTTVHECQPVTIVVSLPHEQSDPA